MRRELAAIAVVLTLASPPAQVLGQARAANETTYAVTGVASDDVLNIRDRPDGKRIIGHIPPHGRGVVTIGPRTKVPRAGTWVQIRYAGTVGWVNARFLSAEAPQPGTLSRRASSDAGLPAEASVEPFYGSWSRGPWTVDIDAARVSIAGPADLGRPPRAIGAGSRECGSLYERNFAVVEVEDIPTIFTDRRFLEWTASATPTKSIRIMVVTCGSSTHRFFFLLGEQQRMLVAEWAEREWLMYEELARGPQKVGRQ